jgi:hypothetical protein
VTAKADMHHDEEPTTAAHRAAAQPRTARGVLVAVAFLRRRWAAEYSFFIAFPTILAGTGVQAARTPSRKLRPVARDHEVAP